MCVYVEAFLCCDTAGGGNFVAYSLDDVMSGEGKKSIGQSFSIYSIARLRTIS